MEVIPAIDLRWGRCVRLYQGDYSRETVFSEDPLGVAMHWQELGAPRLHVVDLDGAFVGTPRNAKVTIALIKALKAEVQVGAGIVADSDPAREWEETENKGMALIRAIELVEGSG